MYQNPMSDRNVGGHIVEQDYSQQLLLKEIKRLSEMQHRQQQLLYEQNERQTASQELTKEQLNQIKHAQKVQNNLLLSLQRSNLEVRKTNRHLQQELTKMTKSLHELQCQIDDHPRANHQSEATTSSHSNDIQQPSGFLEMQNPHYSFEQELSGNSGESTPPQLLPSPRSPVSPTTTTWVQESSNETQSYHEASITPRNLTNSIGTQTNPCSIVGFQQNRYSEVPPQNFDEAAPSEDTNEEEQCTQTSSRNNSLLRCRISQVGDTDKRVKSIHYDRCTFNNYSCSLDEHSYHTFPLRRSDPTHDISDQRASTLPR